MKSRTTKNGSSSVKLLYLQMLDLILFRFVISFLEGGGVRESSNDEHFKYLVKHSAQSHMKLRKLSHIVLLVRCVSGKTVADQILKMYQFYVQEL